MFVTNIRKDQLNTFGVNFESVMFLVVGVVLIFVGKARSQPLGEHVKDAPPYV